MDASFDQYKDGKYCALDMGYILMAVLRFFIEENNFKEKDITYNEYLDFFKLLVKRDFGLELSDEECREAADYVFDKIKMKAGLLSSGIMIRLNIRKGCQE